MEPERFDYILKLMTKPPTKDNISNSLTDPTITNAEVMEVVEFMRIANVGVMDKEVEELLRIESLDVGDPYVEFEEV